MRRDIAIVDLGGGIAECRICGLMFVPESSEDREAHEARHREVLWGGLPYDIREMLKRAGWEAIEAARGKEGGWAERERELGKRAVAYGWWARAVAKGIPENDFERFMAAELEYLDAVAAGDEAAIEAASRATEQWKKYGG